MLVIDKLILANKGVSILNKFLISNWSSGLKIVIKNMCKFTVLQRVSKKV